MTKTLGFGIIGCGIASKWHADSVNAIDGASLIGVADVSRERAEAFAADYGCRTFGDAKELIASPDIDIVCICTPSGLHADYAVAAADFGKHFVVEKPLAITREQLSEVISACESNNVKGCVISQLRFTPVVRAVKTAIDNGLLGRLLLGDVTMKYYRAPEYYMTSKWKGTFSMDGGGALMNQGIHGVDIIQHLMGAITSVSGYCRTLVHDIEAEDTACLTVEYASGAIGTIRAATSVPPGYPRHMEISGTKGTVTFTEERITRWDVEGVPAPAFEELNQNNMGHKDPTSLSSELHTAQLREFIDAIVHDRRPLSDIYEGEKAVNAILAAYESSKSGKKIEITERNPRKNT